MRIMYECVLSSGIFLELSKFPGSYYIYPTCRTSTATIAELLSTENQHFQDLHENKL